MHNLRFVVRDSFVEALVECQEMTRRASIGEFYGCHQFAASDWFRRLETFRGDGKKFVAVLVVDRSGAIPSVRISQVGGSGGWAMAIAAFEVHESAVWSAANWFHVNRVIELDGGGIARRGSGDRTQRDEFGMAFLEAINLSDVSRIRVTDSQFTVATGTCLIPNGGKVGRAAMFGMARRAAGCGSLGGMMGWAIVAGEAGAVGSFRRKCFGLAHVAGGTLFFEDGVGSGQAAAAVNAGIAGQAFFGDPKEGQQQEHEAEPKLGALERRRPLEIIQIDALGELFRCACASHWNSR